MKKFSKFIAEAATAASQQAKRLGLQGDGHGDWYDKQGNLVAKTVKGTLKFFGKRSSSGSETPQRQRNSSIKISEPQKKPLTKTPEPQQKSSTKTPESEIRKSEKDAGEKVDSIDTSTSDETLTVGFGRFNPPTVGHEKLLNHIKKVAADGEYRIYPSHSQDAKKNPLDSETKVGYMRKMYPDHSSRIVHDTGMKTIFDVLKGAHQQGYKNVNIVVGADRLQEFEKLANKYNGNLYNFETINVVSAGERDPDAEGVEGMSASKLRKHAKDGDFETFFKGVPKALGEKDARKLYNTVRKNMGLDEEFETWEIAPKLDWKNLRENYITGKIFQVGKTVENMNTGLMGSIIRTGTNYVICVTEAGEMFKSWIHDINEVYKVGTDEYRRYVQRITPNEPIRDFINKNKKKLVSKQKDARSLE